MFLGREDLTFFAGCLISHLSSGTGFGKFPSQHRDRQITSLACACNKMARRKVASDRES